MKKAIIELKSFHDTYKWLLWPIMAFLWGYLLLAADSRYVSKPNDAIYEKEQTQKINDLDVRLARIEAKCDLIIDSIKK